MKTLGDLTITSHVEWDVDAPDGIARLGNLTIKKGGSLTLYGAAGLNVKGNMNVESGGSFPQIRPARSAVDLLGDLGR